MTERSGMICDICALCVRVFVLCVIYVYGPEGNYLMGRKANILWAGRRVSHGPEGIVQLTGRSGPGKAYVRKLYIGELTKHLCFQLLCMCFRY